jgi:hypothetical protein
MGNGVGLLREGHQSSCVTTLDETIGTLLFSLANPMKFKFAKLEPGIDCEIVPVDLTKGEQAQPRSKAMNPFGRVPVFVDGDLAPWESQAILAYLGEKTGKLWPSDAAGPLENLSHRVSMPEDVAAANVLCLPESKQIRGQTIHTSAGQCL